jgi:ribosomal protein S18 acetylase RimI-like enzyme
VIKIRHYQPQDNAVVKALHYAGLAQFGAKADPFHHDDDLDDIENEYINNKGDFIVGILKNEIVAMGAIHQLSDQRGEIKRIRVRQDCQRRGYGQTILLKLMEIAERLGYTEIQLDSVSYNTPARHLFEKNGFRETHYKNIGTYNIVFYEKNLSKKGA